MLINEHTAVRSNKLTLVPYTKSHVPEYHEWMQDPEIQAATASEPLTLEEEYAMQESWRRDGDKLTFIITKSSMIGKEEAIGDVNLFLSTKDNDDDDEGGDQSVVVGELEVMIAKKEEQGQGYGRAALLLFLTFILCHQAAILKEYGREYDDLGKTALSSFSVKIGGGNSRSIKLFENLGFRKVKVEANYFGEFELSLPVDERRLEEVKKLLHKYDIRDYEETNFVGER